MNPGSILLGNESLTEKKMLIGSTFCAQAWSVLFSCIIILTYFNIFKQEVIEIVEDKECKNE